MGGKRVWLAELLFKTRLIEILSRFSGHNKLIVLNYHRVRPDATSLAVSFDDGVVSVHADQFLRQMNWLKSHTRILSEQELIDQIVTNRYQQANGPSVVITFDDGYYDNYSIAYPILKSLQIPAIFFICTEMVWERNLCWWDVVAYLIKQCRKPSIVIHEREYILQGNHFAIIEELQTGLKQCPWERIPDEIRLISEAAETDLPSAEIQDRELMTRDHIREMAANQMAIGSHTHTHRVLSSIDHHEHQTELMLSKQLLEKTTGQAVRSVSYPFGRYRYIPSSIQEAARKCGYQLGFTSNFGVNYLNRIDDMALKRFSGELDDVSTVSLITVWPELFASKEETGFSS